MEEELCVCRNAGSTHAVREKMLALAKEIDGLTNVSVDRSTSRGESSSVLRFSTLNSLRDWVGRNFNSEDLAWMQANISQEKLSLMFHPDHDMSFKDRPEALRYAFESVTKSEAQTYRHLMSMAVREAIYAGEAKMFFSDRFHVMRWVAQNITSEEALKLRENVNEKAKPQLRMVAEKVVVDGISYQKVKE